MANLWHIGNTTVRTPYRLRDALIALAHSEYHGNLVGKARPVIKFWEMAILQLTNPENGYDKITKRILKYRKERKRSGNKKRFDREMRLKEIWTGAGLPTDNRETAKTVIRSLIQNIKELGKEIVLPKLEDKTPQELSIIRHDIEGQLSRIKENEFANKQIENWEEILHFMFALQKPRRRIPFRDEEISIPAGEAPAFFEWVLWRAFLVKDYD